MEHSDLIQKSIIRDMAEGVMTIGQDGLIGYVNQAAANILGFAADELLGRSFAVCFFEHEENEAFVQLVLDAIYDQSHSHEGIVPFYTGSKRKQLRVTTSFLRNGDDKIGIIAVLGDISELVELRDAVKAMEHIRALNGQLELRNKLLSETFGRFLSDEIVRQLLETPDGLALGGKKRALTIVMSDLRGFTALSERMPAQDLLSMLNHYLGEMTDIIQRRGGTIIEFIGDGIMAIFGAPVPSQTHAADAVAAALEMQAHMKSVNAWNAQHGFPVLQMGIGINTGEVIVGNIGSEKRTKYGVVGSHVNLAGRIESYTVGGQILIAPTTRAAIDAELTIAQEQIIFPKGAKAPLTISHVIAIGAPYHAFCQRLGEPLEDLHSPIPVSFSVIREKHVDSYASCGVFLALSRTGARLRTDAALSVFDNIQLNIGGDLYAKVLEADGTEYVLRFTSLPPEFSDWYLSAKK